MVDHLAQSNALPALTPEDIAALTTLRHDLHRHPELSGQETETAARICAALSGTVPDEVLTGLGGHGIAALYGGTEAGPTVLLRCELDALPIEELSDSAHRSTIPGKGHLCGHDGHMAILMGVARHLSRNRPQKGQVILLFQPAEEDGSGAAKVLEDPNFSALSIDYALSLHNMPGIPLGHVALEEGPANCASCGLEIRLSGRTAHASQPETGTPPTPAIAALISALTALSNPTPEDPTDFALATITHIRVGEPAFGVAPGDGTLWVTLRSLTDAGMDHLCQEAEAAVETLAKAHGLTATLGYHDHFRACRNDPEATAALDRAIRRLGLPKEPGHLPMRASEDFGRFADISKSAMFLLGSGTDSPALHNPDYDFPDALIPIGTSVFMAALDDLLRLPTP
ncbi:MAG: amidohydrolase [Rhodobacteraceae bacterium]|nr:amidohydrolase [Paracoccaceae bacterium]